MPIFAAEILDEVKEGKLTFYKLTVDGVSLYDKFCRSIESNAQLVKSLNTIRAYMNFLAENDAQLPKAKFNSIKSKQNVVGYEFKKDSLRIYVIKQKPNVYVVLGGYKSTQKKDIEKFIKIGKEYIQAINTIQL